MQDPRHRRTIAGIAMLAAFAAAPAAHAQVAVDHESTVVAEQAGNGNGIVEPGETLSLTENVLSVEFATLTGVTGTLSSSTPGVTIPAADAAWPDLDFASIAGNLTPFSAALPATLPCGVPASFTVALSTSAGPGQVAFSVPTGTAGAFASTDATGLPAAIPDPGTLDLPLTLGTSGNAKGLRVRIGSITHPYDGDLRLELIAPDGRSVVLADRRGGPGQDWVSAVFDDAAATSVLAASAPFTGSLRPEQALSTLDGAPLAGTWILRVADASTGQAGSVGAWGLDAAPAVCASTTPPPPVVDDRPPHKRGHRPHKPHKHHKAKRAHLRWAGRR